jgi:putative tricarboxylic transport membrane protein
MFFSGLKILLPEKLSEEVNHKVLDYKKVSFLIIIMIFYGLTILRVGFFLSTSVFLLLSYYYLGERRWTWMIIFSFPFVALFMFLLHGILDIYLRDPLLKLIGVIG